MDSQQTAELAVNGGGGATELSQSEVPARIPIVQVAFHNGMWWSIPQDMSQKLYAHYKAGKDACYTWDWGDTRSGSWPGPDPAGESSINRYLVDFDRMQQKNIDNGRMRSIRLAWVRQEDVTPQWTGQIPS